MRLACYTACLLLTTLLPANAADWPHWRGPSRGDVVAEASGWEAGGWPGNVAWKLSVGPGSTSGLVIDGRLYTLGWNDNRDTLYCLDAATGKEIWKQSYPCPQYGRKSTGDKGIYSGCSSTPEYDPATGLLYTLSIDGDLNCWDTRRDGKNVWAFNLYQRYDPPQRPDVGGKRGGQSLRDYGYTTAPLVQGDTLIVEVGATGKAGSKPPATGTLMGFDKQTGEQRWASECADEAGHSGGPVPMTVEKVPCVAVLTLRNLLVTRIDKGHEGKTVAKYPWTTDFANNIPTPAVLDNYVVVTSAYNRYAICKLKITLKGATREWEQPHASGVCSPIIHNGHIYWAWRGVHCLDFKTGQEKWVGGNVGSAGSCILTADNRLIVWADQGELLLVETAERSPDKYTELFHKGRLAATDVWPHVVLADGRLYCKDRQGNLTCFARDRDQAPPTIGSQPSAGTPRPSARPAEPAVNLKSWPGELPGLVLAWKRGFGEQAVVAHAGEQPNGKCKLVTREAAGFDDDGRMRFTRGAIVVDGTEDLLQAACRKSGELGLEIVFSANDAKQSGPARIVTFSNDGYSRNFTLGQEGDRLLFRLRTPQTGTNGMNPQTDLPSIAPNRPQHVVVAYRDGELACYLNGALVKESTAVNGDFSNWGPQHLLFGDEWDGGNARNWSGNIERVAIYSRFIGPKEARQRFDLAKMEKGIDSTANGHD